MPRQQLPPQIEKITLKSGAIRYEVIAEAGVDPQTGKRRQTRKRYKTEEEARDRLAEVSSSVRRGTYVAPAKLTIEQACSEWLAGKRVRKTTRAAYTHALQPLRDRHGSMPVQRLTKADLDNLVEDLESGEFVYKPSDRYKDGRHCKPWDAETINPMLRLVSAVLKSLVSQGVLVRDIAALVDRASGTKPEMQTYTPAEARKVLAVADQDRNGHAWHMALSGMRRGEICGLRWSDVDLKVGTLKIRHNRVQIDGIPEDSDSTKTDESARTLPLTQPIREALKRAKKIQAAEKLALGEDYGPGTHVLCDEAGFAYRPDKITKQWNTTCKAAGVRHIRLHDARHTCGTLMHLQNVPIAVIAAWLGHADSAFTMRTYVHSQQDALVSAARTLEGVVTNRDNSAPARSTRKRPSSRKSAG